VGHNVCITLGASTVGLDTNATIGSLQLGTGNTLNFNDNTQLTVNGPSIINGGAISLNSGGSFTALQLAGTTALSGGGTVTLSVANHNDGAVGINGSGVTLENMNNTIQGEGSIGFGNSLVLQNDMGGTVNANVLGHSLILNGTGGVINAGVLEATNGGALDIHNTINNNGGTISTDSGNGSAVQLFNGSNIQGGTLNGNVQTVGGNSAILDGVTHGTLTNAATFIIVDNSTLNLATNSTLNNTGTIAIASGGNGTFLNLGSSSGTAILTGSGTVTMSIANHNDGAVGIDGNGGVILENKNNTIQGEGSIGFGHNMVLQNDALGTVNANVSGHAINLNGAGGVINAGVLEATNGGALNISNTINNSGGTMSTDSGNGSVVQLFNGSNIQGGTLNGNVQTGAGHTTEILDGATHGAVTNAGTLTIVDNSTLNVAANSTLNNTGSIAIASGGNGTYLYLGNNAGTTILQGSGTVTLSIANHNDGAVAIYGDGGVTLENKNNTIQGEGTIGLGRNMVLQNDIGGTVNANVLGHSLILNGSGGVINAGVLEATNGGALNIFNTINNSGTISTDTGLGSAVQLFNGANIQGGTLNGNVQVVAGNTSPILDGVNHGMLTNAGTVTIQDAAQLSLANGSTINNTGSIAIASGGNGTYLYVGNGGTATLQGNGTVTLSIANHNDGAIGIYGDNATLENKNNLIQGEGTIGFAGHNMVLQNDGLGIVNANVSGHALYLNSPAGVINAGLLEATNGGALNISNTINNSGTISTDIGNGSVVQLFNGANIQGGLLNGNVQVVAGNTSPILDGGAAHGMLTNAGTVTVQDAAQLTLANGSIINNTGSIAVASGGNATYLYAGSAGTTTLQGNGTLTLSIANHNDSAVGIYGDGGVTLDNKNNTIQGEGTIGFNHTMVLQNEIGGTVNANVTGHALNLNPASGVINTGLLEATNGGALNILSTTINNSGGTISTDIGNGSVVQLFNGANIQGGLLNANVQVVAGNTSPILDGFTHGVLTNAGTVTVQDAATLNLANGSTINNTGAIAVASGGNATYLYVGNGAATSTLDGKGTVTLSIANHNDNAVGIFGDGGVTLDNKNNTIQGEGTIGFGHAMNVTNESGGTILANVNGHSLTINNTGTLTNPGTLAASGGGALVVASPTVLAPAASGGFDVATHTLTGNYIVDGSAGSVSTLQINPLGNTGGEVTQLGNGVLKSSITLNGSTANTLFHDSAGLNALNLNTVTGNASLTLEGTYAMNTTGAFANAGTVSIAAGSSLNPAGAYTQSAGTTTVNGNLNASSVTINGGVLQGTGTVDPPGATTIASGGTLLPGAVGTPGTINIGGALNINSGGALSEGINGAGAGQFAVTNVAGAMTISGNGVLNISESMGIKNGSTQIAVGQTLTIMNSSGLTGGFTNGSLAGDTTFNNGKEKWTVSNVGNNEVLLASSVNPINATWTTSSGNWTQNTGSPSFTTKWSCDVAVMGGCVPNNNVPPGTTYNAILNSAGNTMTLSNTDTPSNIAVNDVNLQHGTLVVTGGATLTSNGNLTNSDTLQVDGGSKITAGNLTNYNTGALSGGNWNLNGTGAIQSASILATGITTLAAGTNVTLNGVGAAGGASGLQDFLGNDALAQLNTNNGNLTVMGGRTFTGAVDVTNSGSVIVGANSTVNIGAGGANNYTNTAVTSVTGALNANNVNDSGGTHVFNGGTLTADGSYSESGVMTIDNGGTVIAPTYTNTGNTMVSGTLIANNYNDNGGPGNFTNVLSGGALNATGTYTLNGGATNIMMNGLLTAGTYIQNSGMLDIVGGGKLTTNEFNLKGGRAQVDGTLDPASIDIFASAELLGIGNLIGSVDNSGTIFGGDDQSHVGTLSQLGDYKQESGGAILEDILSGSTYSHLAITGNVTDVAGAVINIDELNFTPFNGELFTILTFTGILTGQNYSVTGIDAGDFTVVYDAHDISLKFDQGGPPPVPEPSFVLMNLVVAGILAVWKFRRKRAHSSALGSL
jgi:hypothetical protein